MTTQTISDTTLYERTLMSIIQTLPAERVRQIVDFARFMQLQISDEVVQVDEAVLVEDTSKPVPRRRPHPALAGKGRTIGDIVSPIVDEEDWECLKW